MMALLLNVHTTTVFLWITSIVYVLDGISYFLPVRLIRRNGTFVLISEIEFFLDLLWQTTRILCLINYNRIVVLHTLVKLVISSFVTISLFSTVVAIRIDPSLFCLNATIVNKFQFWWGFLRFLVI